MYSIKKGKESTFISGFNLILAECTQEHLKEIYEKGDKRFIETPADKAGEKKIPSPIIKEVPEKKTRKKRVKKEVNNSDE